ncbi:hypothetical protein G7Y89_g5753 [Cudoniella acicularis]|uniref:Reverse transcriptase Ty1/copia-type domain-containing protein n=1 Tax=Cudoniella acicularis TaxID=354080 RepID=A0A8H4W3I2_9HELO|nr:hypothetical protein G7Y89_g5753 [Cudoniella acicularis]
MDTSDFVPSFGFITGSQLEYVTSSQNGLGILPTNAGYESDEGVANIQRMSILSTITLDLKEVGHVEENGRRYHKYCEGTENSDSPTDWWCGDGKAQLFRQDVHIPKEKDLHKLKVKGWKGIFVGYGPSGYSIWNPQTREVEVTAHTKIKDGIRGSGTVNAIPTQGGLEIIGWTQEANTDPIDDPRHEDNSILLGDTIVVDAIVSEIQSLRKNHTGVSYEDPKVVISSRANGSLKSKQMANTRHNLSHMDIRKNTELTTSRHTLQLLDLSMDAKTAFLYGDLDEEIYTEQPEGYSEGTDLVCKLRRSLYGLKQAPWVWNKVVDSFFGKQGITRPLCDPAIYFRRKPGGKGFPLMISIYVDDIIIGPDMDEIKDLKTELSRTFDMTNLGEAKRSGYDDYAFRSYGVIDHMDQGISYYCSLCGMVIFSSKLSATTWHERRDLDQKRILERLRSKNMKDLFEAIDQNSNSNLPATVAETLGGVTSDENPVMKTGDVKRPPKHGYWYNFVQWLQRESALC